MILLWFFGILCVLSFLVLTFAACAICIGLIGGIRQAIIDRREGTRKVNEAMDLLRQRTITTFGDNSCTICMEPL